MKPFAYAVLLAGTALAAGHVAPAMAAAINTNLPPSAALLLRYDANHDGVVTKEEMETGLKADFDLADTNHDNCLSNVEARAENDRRLHRDGGQASPLVDWNLDGCVDMAEFGNTVRSYFGFVDKTKDGRVTQIELRGPSMPIPLPGGKGKPKDDDQNQGPPTDTIDTVPGVSY